MSGAMSGAPAPDTGEVMVFAMSEWLLAAEVVQLGLASALNQVAALLAQARGGGRGPIIEDPAALTLVRTPRQAFLARSEAAALAGASRRFEAPEWIAQVMPRLGGRARQFMRPVQIDVQGRINTLRVATRQGGTRRLAGLAGLAELSELVHPFLTYMPQQDRRGFVEAVDFVVADPLAAHPPGKGQVILVTDLAVFEFTAAGARVRSLHPGVSLERLAERTPASVAIGDPPPTAAPDPELLHRLRTSIDPRRVRDIEFVAAAQRREALLRLYAAEHAQPLRPG